MKKWAEKAADLALILLQEQSKLTTSKERAQMRYLASLVQNPKAKTFMTLMSDQCFRSKQNGRTVDQLLFLLKTYGFPSFLPLKERIKFLIFTLFGRRYENFFASQIRKNLQKEISSVLFVDDNEFNRYIKEKQEQNISVIFNYLGESVLGEKEADHRISIYKDILKKSEIPHLSIKISTLYSQIQIVAFDESLKIIKERLASLYEVALANDKVITLDMEEYRDLELTYRAFKELLSEERFLKVQAGMVLQSYLPDSFAVQKELTEWAIKRAEKGGAQLHLRLVKGANLAMERVESSVRIWNLVTFNSKAKTDAQYKKMVHYALDNNRTAALNLSIASHNLFDIAYALTLAEEKQLTDAITFELLAGMAEPTLRALAKRGLKTRVYVPKTTQKDLHNSVAYLIRRLDENTATENFLHDIFALHPYSPQWQEQKEHFYHSFDLVHDLPEHPFRTTTHPIKPMDSGFSNEPDTDFSLKESRRHLKEMKEKWQNRESFTIPLVIEGKEVITSNLSRGIDPSFPQKELYKVALADKALLERALACAKRAVLPKLASLEKVAAFIRQERFHLIGVLIADGGKVVEEADIEISEAIDFIEYYIRNFEKLRNMDEYTFSPKGTLLVAPPWNFPCSIAVGGIAASLIAGNSVLFKPAPETRLIGYEIAKLFWQGGVSKEKLQFINCEDDPEGSFLIGHPDINAVIVTGATATAQKFLQLRPTLDLHAETGGKNCFIITSLADKELAIKHLVHSAFGHAGQKCSAASIGILEREVYENKEFLDALVDAAQSLSVGSPWDFKNKIPPLIKPPEGALLKGLTSLSEGESWLLEPKPLPDSPYLWTPGIKIGVKEGSYSHQTEFFGPILSLMCAKNLPHAIQIANNTPYGLTSGLHSLDTREQKLWKENINAGNLYINRTITGAIVRRQPFGGCKASSFGPGAKAGGPNYLLQLMHIEEKALPEERGVLPAGLAPLISSFKNLSLSPKEIELWRRSAESYVHFNKLFKEKSDPSAVLGEDNEFGYLPRTEMWLWVDTFSIVDLIRVIAACHIVSVPLFIFSKQKIKGLPHLKGCTMNIVEEEEFIKRLYQQGPKYLRLIAPLSAKIAKATGDKGITLLKNPVYASGRFELLNYLQEQTVSHQIHRYGYIPS